MRFWTRRGHGIHSPWVYELVTGVIAQKHQYYAYSELPSAAGWPIAELQLLLRLANHFQPSVIALSGIDDGAEVVTQWLKAGCRCAEVTSSAAQEPLIVMTRPEGEQLTITVGNTSARWQQLVGEHSGIYLDRRHLCLCYQGLNIPTQYHRI